MELKEVIYKRKSIRKYQKENVEKEKIEKILNFFENAKAIFPNIKVRIEITKKENVKCIFPWISEQVISVFSEEKEGFLENVGFLLQQLDLFLPTLGLGSCWLGMGKLDSVAKSKINDGLQFVIMLAFGYPKEELYRDKLEFKRKPLDKISDEVDLRLEPARFAPSSINTQPWYFVHEGNIIHTYCVRRIMRRALEDMNRIDVGISLAHLYVSNIDTFEFIKLDNANKIDGYFYIGSFKL